MSCFFFGTVAALQPHILAFPVSKFVINIVCLVSPLPDLTITQTFILWSLPGNNK
jgi:hypothetical protein